MPPVPDTWASLAFQLRISLLNSTCHNDIHLAHTRSLVLVSASLAQARLVDDEAAESVEEAAATHKRGREER
eukprot:6204744-Pleurochrysis_carterae.AAC.2